MDRPKLIIVIIAVAATVGYLLLGAEPVKNPRGVVKSIPSDGTSLRSGTREEPTVQSDSSTKTTTDTAINNDQGLRLAPLSEEEEKKLKLNNYEEYLRYRQQLENSPDGLSKEQRKAAARERIKEKILPYLEEQEKDK